MIRSLLPFLLLFIGIGLRGQTIVQGTISSQHNIPVPYAAVGIKNSRTAALADENGSYRVVIPDSLALKPIIFSAIGHVERSMSLAELKKNSNVVLQEKIETLNEVVVNATIFKQKTIGQRSRPMLTFSRMFDQNVPTIEQGSIFELFAQTRLKSYGFYIIPSSKFSKIKLKLNLYSVNGDMPEKTLLHKTILFECSTTGWQRIDLDPYDLQFRNIGKIAITLQLVDHTPLTDTAFVFGLSGKKSLAKNLLFRYQSQGNWEASEGTFISNLELAYSSSGNKKQQVDEKEYPINDQDSQQLDALVQVIGHRAEAKKTMYGKNRNGKYLDVRDGKIYYEEYGSGRPLLLLHGNGGSIADFFQQIPYLSKHFRVIAIDARGQGRSTNLAAGPYSYGQFSDDLLQLTRALKLQKVSILGWSDGGNTGLLFNAAHPMMVEKLITIGANLNPNGIKEEFLASLTAQLKGNTQGADLRLIQLMLDEPQLSSTELEKIKNPVLVVAGSTDLIKEAHTRMIGKAIKGSRVVIIPDAGHYVPFDQPARLNQLVLQFLEQ